VQQVQLLDHSMRPASGARTARRRPGQRSSLREHGGRRAGATLGHPSAWTMRPEGNARSIEGCGEWIAGNRVARDRHREGAGEQRVAIRWQRTCVGQATRGLGEACRKALARNGVARDRHAEGAARQRAASAMPRAWRQEATGWREQAMRKRSESHAVAPRCLPQGAPATPSRLAMPSARGVSDTRRQVRLPERDLGTTALPRGAFREGGHHHPVGP
jgi:hypothetical protein